MTYYLSFRDFEEYVRGIDRRRPDDEPLGEREEGEQLARIYVFTRFKRCHGSPVPPPALYPKPPPSCAPAAFNDEAHWDSVYRRLAKQRTTDLRRKIARERAHAIDVPASHAEHNPIEGLTFGDDPADVVERNEWCALRDAVSAGFDESVAFGPEIKAALEEAIDHALEGGDADLIQGVKASLRAALPMSMGSDDAGRQRLSRAVRRAREFLEEWWISRNSEDYK